jgi:hypothetical protein
MTLPEGLQDPERQPHNYPSHTSCFSHKEFRCGAVRVPWHSPFRFPFNATATGILGVTYRAVRDPTQEEKRVIGRRRSA